MKTLTQTELEEVLKNHKLWLETRLSGICSGKCADLSGANLRHADPCSADLRNANLRGIELDFACISLSCSSLRLQIDRKIMAQLAYHFCSHGCKDDEVKHYQDLLLPLANEFHRVEECGILQPKILDKREDLKIEKNKQGI